MPDPDISVIIPTRNRAPLVGRLIEQLLRIEDHLTYEIIVVDEASSDCTPDLLAEFERTHGVVSVRHDVPRGLSGARNVGLRLAKSPWVAWIDDDDLTSTDRLRRQYEAVTTTPARWSCAARVDIDDDLRVLGHMECPPLENIQARMLRSNPLPTAGQGLLVERSLAVEVGGYDEALDSAEDWDFCIRLVMVAEPHLLNEPLVGYRVGQLSMSTNGSRMEAAIRKVTTKHRELYERFGVEPDVHAMHHALLTAELTTSRWRAVDRAWRAARARPSAQAAARLAAICVAPGWVLHRSRRRRIEQVPVEWEARAREWLDNVPALRSTGC